MISGSGWEAYEASFASKNFAYGSGGVDSGHPVRERPGRKRMFDSLDLRIKKEAQRASILLLYSL